MNQIPDSQAIAYLICKQLLGTITSEELLILNRWRQADSCNEAAFQRLMDPDFLAVELQRSMMLDHHRPLHDMKRQVTSETGLAEDGTAKRHMLRRYAVSAAAAFLLLIGGVWMWQNMNGPKPEARTQLLAQHEIMPGHTQAMLTLDNGATITLGNDADQNDKAIAEAAKGTEIQMNDLTTPRGGEFKVTLEDGTEVWLNAESKLRYPETFAGNERRVEITGEAYFKVAHDSAKPFYVVSGGQEIRVYGTEFNVHAYSDEPDYYTTLVNGSIALRTLGGNQSEFVLTPGHQAVYNKTDASAKIHKVDTDVVTSWRSGIFVFEEQTMEQIMRTLSRWYNFQYEFADNKIASTVFMGSIPRYGSFSEVVDIFQKMGGFRLRQKGNKIIISKH